MKTQKWNDYKAQFLKGKLSTEELETLSKAEKPYEDFSFLDYLDGIKQIQNEKTVVISRDSFEQAVHQKNKQRKALIMMAASFAGLIMIATTLLFLSNQKTESKQLSKAEIDQSIMIMQKAFSSITMNYQTGLNVLDSGLNLTQTMKPMHNYQPLMKEQKEQ